MPRIESYDEYVKALKGHDWFYEYSDDGTVWRAGRDAYVALRAATTRFDPDMKVWDEHAPPEFRSAAITAAYRA